MSGVSVRRRCSTNAVGGGGRDEQIDRVLGPRTPGGAGSAVAKARITPPNATARKQGSTQIRLEGAAAPGRQIDQRPTRCRGADQEQQGRHDGDGADGRQPTVVANERGGRTCPRSGRSPTWRVARRPDRRSRGTTPGGRGYPSPTRPVVFTGRVGGRPVLEPQRRGQDQPDGQVDQEDGPPVRRRTARRRRRAARGRDPSSWTAETRPRGTPRRSAG